MITQQTTSWRHIRGEQIESAEYVQRREQLMADLTDEFEDDVEPTEMGPSEYFLRIQQRRQAERAQP